MKSDKHSNILRSQCVIGASLLANEIVKLLPISCISCQSKLLLTLIGHNGRTTPTGVRPLSSQAFRQKVKQGKRDEQAPFRPEKNDFA